MLKRVCAKFVNEVEAMLGLVGSNPTSVPGVKFTSQQLEVAVPLEDSEATLYRQVVGKLLHVQDDYPDSQYVIKRLSREMAHQRPMA